MEVKHVTIGVLDRDGGQWSHEIIQRLNGSPNVAHIVRLDSDAALARAIRDWTSRENVPGSAAMITSELTASRAAEDWIREVTTAVHAR